MSRFILVLILAIICGYGKSYADHDRGANQSIQDIDTLPDFDDMETLPDLDELGPLDDAPPIEKNIPDQQTPARENIKEQPDLSNSIEPNSSFKSENREPDVNATPEELYRAGGRFFRGVDGPQDYEKAFKWIKLAAEKGHSQAQNDVGVMYETGQGVNQDLNQAMYWFKKSAAGNYPLAHYNLGRAYDSGMGGRKNFSEAIKSYRRAAKLGEAKAQKRLRQQRLRW